MRVRLGIAVLLVASLAAGAAWVAGRDGGTFALDPVARAASTASADTSFRFTFRAADASGTGRVTGSGAYDADHELLRTHVSVPLFGGAPAGADMIADGSGDGLVVYVHLPVLAAALPGGREWVKLDVGKAAKSSGIDLQQLLQLSGSSPTDVLSALAHANGSTVVGTETLGGVETTHYRTTVTPKDLAATQPPGAARDQLERALANAPGSATVDVWIDAAEHIRRVGLELPSLAGSGAAATFVENLSGYGDAVDVTLPTDDQVIDVTGRALHG